MGRRLSLLLLALPVAFAVPVRAAAGDVAGSRPSVRVRWSPGDGLPDRDADGVPDAAADVLRIAARVADEFRAAGLETPGDGADGGLDLWLGEGPPPAGTVGLPAREALRDPPGFRAEVGRRLAEAFLRRWVPGAPAWWVAPSACWLAERATGLRPSSCGNPALRWTHPEPGLLATGPLLAPSNLALLECLGGVRRVRSALRATWRRLATDPGDPVGAVNGGLVAAGLDLPGLFLRAGIARIAAGNLPARESLRVENLPVLEKALEFPPGPLGGALLHLLPDPRFPAATVVEIDPDGRALRGVVLGRRQETFFDRVDLRPDPDGVLRVTIPWHDYREAFLLLVRPDAEPGPLEVLVDAEPGDPGPPFELVSFSATATAGGNVFVEWRTGREDGVVAWIVERSLDDGPWQAATPVPLPSLGSLTGGGSYVVPAGPVPAGSVSRWRLVALLADGFRRTGPVVRAAP